MNLEMSALNKMHVGHVQLHILRLPAPLSLQKVIDRRLLHKQERSVIMEEEDRERRGKRRQGVM